MQIGRDDKVNLKRKDLSMKPQFFVTVFISFLLCSTPIWSQNNFISIEQDAILALEFLDKAIDLANKAQYDSSNYYYEKASVIYEKIAIQYDDKNAWVKYVTCINKIGSNLIRQGKYETAMEYLNKALEIGLKKLDENHSVIMDIYDNIGIGHEFSGRYDKALNYFHKTILKKKQLLGENHLKVSDSYDSIGRVFGRKEEINKALEYYNKSFAIYLKLLGENHYKVGCTYYNIGLLYRKKGDYDKALEYANKALVIDLASVGENHPVIANDYDNIGTVYSLKGDYDKALEYYIKSLDIKLKSLGENHRSVATNYHNIGANYLSKGDLEKALEYCNKSLAIKLQVLGEGHPDLAISYGLIGKVYLEKRNYDQALEYFNKSKTIRLKTLEENDALVAANYNDIGTVYLKKGNFEKAEEYYNKSLTINLHILNENHPYLARTYKTFGEFYLAQNNFEKALYYGQKVITSILPEFNDTNVYTNPPLTNLRLENILLDALEFKADVLEKLYSLKSHNIEDIKSSLANYQLASEVINKLRSSYKAEGSKIFLAEKATIIFDKAISTALKLYEITQNNKYKEQAFVFAEKAKSSILLASLQDLRAKRFAGIPDSLLEAERDLKIDLTFYDTQIQKELDKTEERDSLKLQEFEAKHFALNTQYQKLIEQIERDYPKYYDLKYQTKSATILEIQDILDNRSALIEYFTGDSAIYIFTLLHDDFDVTQIAIDSSFQVLAESLNKYIKQLDSKNFMATSYQLYNKLMHPIQHKLISKEKLIIIPHGFLYKIPFETLIAQPPTLENKIEYLINRFETTYHYSATLYLNGLKETRDQVKDGSFVFSGFAPVFGDEDKNNEILLASRSLLTDSTVRSFSVDGTRIDELPFSEQEVKTIIEMYKQHNQDAIGYFHANASEENFKTIVSNYRYIHIASHSIINESKPKLSAIIFSQPIDTVDIEDGVLYADEIYNLNLNADLVVLSSCESGIGKLVSGEGMMALTRGFLYAGASNIIVSLWKVHDRHTKELMVELYKSILAGKSYSCALREAKLKMLDKGPKVWSSFVLVGGE